MATAAPDLLAAAERARLLVESDPDAAWHQSAELLRRSRSPALVCAALRAQGLAASRLGRNAEATRLLERAVNVANRAHLHHRAAQARLSLVVVHAADGQFERALQQSALARPALTTPERGELMVQKGVALARLGDTGQAMRCFAYALRLLDEQTQPAWRARVHLNRGLVLTYRGQLARAEQELRESLRRWLSLNLAAGAGIASQNLGYLYTLRGDIPGALEWLDRAEVTMTSVSMDTATTRHDRAEALLRAGLAKEALIDATEAVATMSGHGRAADLAEARLTLARAALDAGDHRLARREANRARHAFSHQGRSGWAAIAEHLVLRARWDSGDRGATLAAVAARCAADLQAAGWHTAAVQASVLAGRVLLHRGRTDDAMDQLSRVRTARHKGPAEGRAAAWHAEALLRLAANDRPAALRALRAGLRVVDEHAGALGATDMRASASTHGRALAQLGVRLTSDAHRPGDVLEWLERARTSVLRRRPVRPPKDTRLASDLTELRRVSTAITSGREAGSTALRAEQVRLERAIRDRARHAPGSRVGAPPLRSAELGAALDHRVLVEYFSLDGRLRAVTVRNGRVRSWQLGEYAPLLRETEALRFALHRLARRHGSAPSLEAAALGARHAASRLDAELLQPLVCDTEGRELVIVPTLALHALPWTALPSLTGRPVSVAPSATSWLAASRRPRRRNHRNVLVAGPDLDFAVPEVEALAELYPAAACLTSHRATADDVRTALDGARIAHLACHGHFRADNPQFSSLQLADGPLMVYDLERLARAPELIVLSSCDAALSAVHPGDELMGLSSALFALGTRTLVASVTPVGDESTMHLMVELHRRLVDGEAPATALATVQRRVDVPGFACFGVG